MSDLIDRQEEVVLQVVKCGPGFGSDGAIYNASLMMVTLAEEAPTHVVEQLAAIRVFTAGDPKNAQSRMVKCSLTA